MTRTTRWIIAFTLGWAATFGLAQPTLIRAADPDGAPANYALDDFAPSHVEKEAGTIGRNLLTNIYIVAAVLTLVYLIWGAIEIQTAGGDSGKLETGRKRMMLAVIGLILVAASWAIFQLVLQITYGSDASGIKLPTIDTTLEET